MAVERRRMVVATVATVALAAVAALGCGDKQEGGPEGKVRLNEEKLELQGTVAIEDEDVVTAMKSPAAPGRIIYDAPTDLSYENARQRRPDLVPADSTARVDTARTAAAKDTNTAEATTIERPRPGALPQEPRARKAGRDSTR